MGVASFIDIFVIGVVPWLQAVKQKHKSLTWFEAIPMRNFERKHEKLSMVHNPSLLMHVCCIGQGGFAKKEQETTVFAFARRRQLEEMGVARFSQWLSYMLEEGIGKHGKNHGSKI